MSSAETTAQQHARPLSRKISRHQVNSTVDVYKRQVLILWLAVVTLPGWARQDIDPVRSGDSLWKIADRIAAAGFSRDQVILALLEACLLYTPRCV